MDGDITKTSYRHKQVRAQTHQHDMYLFWHVVYWPCQASPTPSRIYLSPPQTTGDNTSCTSFACGLLALPSLTHTLKDLPLPPPPQWVAGNDVSHSTPFAYDLLAHWQRPYPHTQGFTCVIQSVSLQLGLLSPRQGNHQHHSIRVKPHQKLTSSMHSKYIVYFQVVS